jgi:hypothetical protein
MENANNPEVLAERTVSGSQESERPVATDVFLHNLEPFTQEALRRAAEQGLTPSGLVFHWG